MALWCGFVVETPAGKFYFAGDTGLSCGPQLPRDAARHGGFRLAILPIGAYEPRWFMEAQHQNPEEAVEGMLLCNAAFAAGCHWGTFHLTNEPIDEPRDRLLAALDARGIARERFRPMLPGEVWDIPDQRLEQRSGSAARRRVRNRSPASTFLAQSSTRRVMIKWILILLIIAAVASLLGFPMLAGAAATGARMLIGVVLVLFLLVIFGLIAVT